MALVRKLLDEWVSSPDDMWVAFYRLLLDYEHGVPRMTDSNRLKKGAWRQRALQVEAELAKALGCSPGDVAGEVDVFMCQMYAAGTQKMNPVGIAFACAIVHLLQRFATGRYQWKMEAKIGVDVFPCLLTGFRRQSVDIVAFQHGQPYAVLSSKWGIRHDRVRDLQEEADIYKREVPTLKFFVTTNEFDNARLQKVLTYPTIDGVFHVRRDLVWRVYSGMTDELAHLRDLTELFPYFP
jgi:hypothetical protein